MNFIIGEQVMHPTFGAGEIVAVQGLEQQTSIQEKVGDGKVENGEVGDGYVIHFVEKRLTMQIPMERSIEVGLRPLMGQTIYSKVFDTLSALPQTLPADFRARQQLLSECIATGQPVQLAEVIRDLAWRRRERRLNEADRELYERAHGRLIVEVAIVARISHFEAAQLMSSAVADGFATHVTV